MDSRHEAFSPITFPAYTHNYKNKSMSISRKHHLFLYIDRVLFSQAKLGSLCTATCVSTGTNLQPQGAGRDI